MNENFQPTYNLTGSCNNDFRLKAHVETTLVVLVNYYINQYRAKSY